MRTRIAKKILRGMLDRRYSGDQVERAARRIGGSEKAVKFIRLANLAAKHSDTLDVFFCQNAK